MAAAVPYRVHLQAKENPVSQQEFASSDSKGRPECWSGLERELERLQVLLDFATGLLRTSVTAMTRIAAEGLAQEAARLQFQDDANRAIASLHLHDVAAQMLADLRARAELETVGLSVPDVMARAHSCLLAEALSDAETNTDQPARCPGSHPEDGAA
ncbi:MAG: hypothetical protein ABI771_09255 [Betaproteobacteria bacterium]